MEAEKIAKIIEAALMAADGPLTVANLVKLFQPGELDEENAGRQIRDALKTLQEEAESRGIELKRVASGYRYQVRQEFSEWVSRLWDEKPPRYTRALLETLALVAYKQPVTRGDIEQVRGVSVSQNIMRTLLERDWVRVVGQREVPGRPSLYGTTKAFLDYFNLKSLDELPPLEEIRAILEPAVVENAGEQAKDNVQAVSALPVNQESLQEPGNQLDLTGADNNETSIPGQNTNTDAATDATTDTSTAADEAGTDGVDVELPAADTHPDAVPERGRVVQLHTVQHTPNSS